MRHELTNWNWMGIMRKLMIWTNGHTMKLALSVGRYISRSLCDTARRPPPSATVMTVKKVAIPKDPSVLPSTPVKTSLQHTNWCKDQLIKGNHLHSRSKATRFRNRESPRQELEPLELNWSHHKAICHESSQSLEVER
jgi:hypothetical protein